MRAIFRPKSEIQTIFSPNVRCSPKKKKKKKVFTKIESDFSAGFVTFRLVGRDASRNGAELFEIEAVFSAKIVTFRLVGGDASPPSPPLNPPLNIPTKLIKAAAHSLSPFLSSIFNSCLESGHYPNRLKIAQVTPLHKGGSKSELKNYRPISILYVFNKILETINYQA